MNATQENKVSMFSAINKTVDVSVDDQEKFNSHFEDHSK